MTTHSATGSHTQDRDAVVVRGRAHPAELAAVLAALSALASPPTIRSDPDTGPTVPRDWRDARRRSLRRHPRRAL